MCRSQLIQAFSSSHSTCAYSAVSRFQLIGRGGSGVCASSSPGVGIGSGSGSSAGGGSKSKPGMVSVLSSSGIARPHSVIGRLGFAAAAFGAVCSIPLTAVAIDGGSDAVLRGDSIW